MLNAKSAFFDEKRLDREVWAFLPHLGALFSWNIDEEMGGGGIFRKITKNRSRIKSIEKNREKVKTKQIQRERFFPN